MKSIINHLQIATVATLLGLAPAGFAAGDAPAMDDVPSKAFLMDLPTVLRLAGARNLDIQIAREKLAEARADNESATLRFFPWLSVGISYARHDGLIQDTTGNILDVNRQSYAPGGALVSQLDLGDAIYKKLAAKQVQYAAGHALEARRQDSILSAAQDYFDLAFAHGAAGVARQAVRISTDYETQLKSAVAAGVAFKGDMLRVSVEAERNRIALRAATEKQRVAAARLAQTLHLDPSVELSVRDATPVPVSLMEHKATLDSLVRRAISLRPELKQDRAMIEAASEGRKGAVYGPLVPTVSASAYGGGLGGGTGGSTGNFGGQQDYSVGLGWRIGPGGLFDHGRQHAAEARLNSAQLNAEKTHDGVIRQVVEAFTRVQSESEQISMARRGLSAAEEALQLSKERQEFGVAVVLEYILAEQDLTRIRTEFLRDIAEFNKAQYELAKAVGTLGSPVSNESSHPAKRAGKKSR